MEKKYSKNYIINTGIGLQSVDNISVSSYFKEQSEKYIKGEISLEELDKLISSYYKNKPNEEDRKAEADLSSIRIAKLISDDSFTFTVGQLITIHKSLFEGILENAGKLRAYNFSKREWILNGKSVIYGDYRELENTLQFDFSIEKKFNYSKLNIDEIIDHLSIFISNLWQIHAFEEGNTRTTAVFIIKYLRTLGFNVTNNTFAKNAWYFRNSLVRANYKDLTQGIVEDRSFLKLFLRNLLLKENNKLVNKELSISYDTLMDKTNSSPANKVILKAMKENPNIRLEELSNLLNVSLRTTKTIVSKLKVEKKIKRMNGNKYGYWKIIEK